MEFIGKGSFEKGCVWVALRVPEGMVLAHANQARANRHLTPDTRHMHACVPARAMHPH